MDFYLRYKKNLDLRSESGTPGLKLGSVKIRLLKPSYTWPCRSFSCNSPRPGVLSEAHPRRVWGSRGLRDNYHFPSPFVASLTWCIRQWFNTHLTSVSVTQVSCWNCAYLTGVNTIIILDGITTPMLCIVGQSFTEVVHAVPAARSGVKVIGQNVYNNWRFEFLDKTEERRSPTTETQAGAGEVLIRKEAAVGYKLTCDFSVEAFTQRL